MMRSTLLLPILMLASCGGDGPTGGPPTDSTAPTVAIKFPPAQSLTSDTEIVVRGTASDDTAVSGVSVGGVAATSTDGFANWTATVVLSNGSNQLTAEATDTAGNRTASIGFSVDKAGVLARPSAIDTDPASNRALVIDSATNSVVAIDLTSGAASMVSANDINDLQTRFRSPVDVDIELGRNRALVTDSLRRIIYAVDLSDGSRSVMSGQSDGESIGSVRSVALDTSADRAFIADGVRERLLIVDLDTGIKAIFSDAVTPNADVPFDHPTSVVLDAVRNRALVADPPQNMIIAVDLDTGQRSVFVVDPALNSGRFPQVALTIDPIRNRVVASNGEDHSLIAYSLNDGASTLLIAGIAARENPLYSLRIPAFDVANDRILITDGLNRVVFAVDPDSGAQTALNEDRIPNTLQPLERPSGTALDLQRGRLLVGDYNQATIVSVDLDSGERTVVAETDQLDPSPNYVSPHSLAVDNDRNRALFLMDRNRPSEPETVFQMDLDSGATSIFSGPDTLNGGVDISDAWDVLIDVERNRALLSDEQTGSIVAIDLDTGERSTFSDLIADPLPLGAPRALALDTAGGRLFVDDRGIVVAIDLDTGVPSIFVDYEVPPPDTLLWRQPSEMVVDPKRNRLLLADVGPNEIVAVDLDNASRTVISDNNGIGNGPPLAFSGNISIDTTNDRIYIVDANYGAVMVVDPETGDRVIISK